MKTNNLKYIFCCCCIILIIACSTKKNSFVNRNWHALNSEYNVLYNGHVALDKGMTELKEGYSDNFWETLPIERMQIPEESFLPGQKPKNPNFERAETKATKAIQKHSMNINGREKNVQMDEAYLLLGKTRYYDLRFIPALEAFNYILYKYPNSDKIYEAKVWREKTNIRLENDAIAIKNLKKLIKDNKLDKKTFADANAILSQAYVNIESKDSAIIPLKKALLSTKLKEEKARYHFILGQIYESLTYKDSAYNEYQQVIDMKRKSPRNYVIQSHARQSQLIDINTDTILFFKKYAKLLKDRENRPYLDNLNYQIAIFYDRLNNKQQAIKYYNKSLRCKSEDTYLGATTYKNLAIIYFDKAKYTTAAKYYDSTLTKLVKKNKEFFTISKKRQNLESVIKYEAIAQKNDSILNLVALSDSDRIRFFESYIAKMKEKENAQKALNLKNKENNTGIDNFENTQAISKDKAAEGERLNTSLLPPNDNSGGSSNNGDFYFYNPTLVAYGKIGFQKKWGKRKLKENWRFSSEVATNDNTITTNQDTISKQTVLKNDEAKYTTDFYIKQIPTDKKIIDSLYKERNFANFQLGDIYKEKFKEYKLSATKYESVLKNNPEERLILPTLYNLYRDYEIIDPSKGETLKTQILLNYPNTRYAQILSGKIVEENNIAITNPKEVYKTLYKQYQNEEYTNILPSLEKSLKAFEGDNLIPQFEFLKASTLGKLKGVDQYKKALNHIVVTYPDTKESTQADEILKNDIPKLEQMALVQDTLSKSWKVLYKATQKDNVETKTLIEKIKKYIAEKKYDNYTVSYDIYNETENFVVVHGISSREYARYFIELLRTNKGYRIQAPAKVISSSNYAVVQIKKNYEQFLELK